MNPTTTILHFNTRKIIDSSIETHSRNFSRWAKSHSRRYKTPLFAAFSTICQLTGKPAYRDETLTQCGQIYIGFGGLDAGFLHGSRLSEILTLGAGAKTWAFGPDFQFIPQDGWIEKYIMHGLQWLDPQHVLYDFNKTLTLPQQQATPTILIRQNSQ